MIYTLTFSPALDLCMWADEINFNKTNRSKREQINVGGKGINVSLVLKELQVDSVALGFVGGFVGEEIEKRLNEAGLKTDFVHINANSRINVKLMGNIETEINAKGPDFTDEDLNMLLQKLSLLQSGDTLIISGSVRDGAIEKILSALSGKRIKTVIDTAGANLLSSLKYEPFFIKPNKQEIEQIFNIECNSIEDISYYSQKLIDLGAQNVAVTLGKDGVLFKNKDTEIYMKAPNGKVLNTVGAGDSFVAGFIAGYLKNNDFTFALKLGTAAGSATAFSLSLATRKEIETVFDSIE